MTKPTDSEVDTTSLGVSKGVVVEAALTCFKRFGPHKTSMSDIAREAGISRKTLYRMFEDRPALVNQVLFQLLRGMGSKVKEALSKFSGVKEAIIEGSVASVNVGKNEKLFQAIVRNETHFQVEHFLVQGNEQIRIEMVNIWSPVFEKGRAEGIIRADLSNERLAEMLQNVHSLLQMRDDKTTAVQRAFLQDLLWAAITNQNTG